MLTQDQKDHLNKLINLNTNVLFMKGDKFLAQCGFSAKVVEILNELSVDFTTFDILQDPEVRAGLKELSQWPTYPQLYHKGELIGGCDIIYEMHQSGELKDLLKGSKKELDTRQQENFDRSVPDGTRGSKFSDNEVDGTFL